MSSFEDYFSIQTFLIVLRETLESAIIISVLLAFIHQAFKGEGRVKNKVEGSTHNNAYRSTEEPLLESSTSESSNEVRDLDNDTIYKYLKLQIWIGGLLGLAICMLIGSIILAVFYLLGSDLWTIAEHYWEGGFSILASIIISGMGIKILRVNKMQKKWKHKLSLIIERSDYINKAIRHGSSVGISKKEFPSRFSYWSEKYAMLILPFVTTLREGLEAIVFIGGIGINENTSIWAIVNSAVTAIIIGSFVGILLYRSGSTLSLQWFLVTSTCFLYLVAAGLFSKGVWHIELQQFINDCGGFDVSETGHGPGSYDIMRSIWHVNCCNGELQDDGPFWMMFTAVFGWTNSATYGSVIGYNFYWLVIIVVFTSLIYEEKHGRLPIIPVTWQQKRINKRLSLNYTAIESSSNEIVQQRESIDSINSSTPLNE
ncbi:iron permease [Scheffersomyces amazonensis]|uniref:iron permease n=1 Tax=Scheffersomyces amazonensis TaxID=1078765 RepID=UPI00315D6F9B